MHVYQWTGPPDTIVSDWGPQFISDFWNEFCRILGVKLRLSTAYQTSHGNISQWTSEAFLRTDMVTMLSLQW